MVSTSLGYFMKQVDIQLSHLLSPLMCTNAHRILCHTSGNHYSWWALETIGFNSFILGRIRKGRTSSEVTLLTCVSSGLLCDTPLRHWKNLATNMMSSAYLFLMQEEVRPMWSFAVFVEFSNTSCFCVWALNESGQVEHQWVWFLQKQFARASNSIGN